MTERLGKAPRVDDINAAVARRVWPLLAGVLPDYNRRSLIQLTIARP